jgi:hypothetical protein
MTPYRSDRDAHIARVDALERELDAARHRASELGRSLWLARPPETRAHQQEYARVYEVYGEISEVSFREAVRTFAELVGDLGRLSADGPHRMTWRARRCAIELAIANGRSTLTCTGGVPAPLSPVLAFAAMAVGGICGALGVWPVALEVAVLLPLGWLASLLDPAAHDASQRRFDRFAALLGIELPRGLPPRPALAAGDQRAR